MKRFPWGPLGIARTTDPAAIRRAYAARLKALDIDRDVAAYEQLRHARDHALAEASRAAVQPAAHAPEADSSAQEVDDLEFEWSLDTPLAEGPVLGDSASIGRPSDPEPLPEAPAPGTETSARAADHDAARAAWDRLAELLFPGGDACEKDFAEEELAAAHDALTQLVAAVEALPLQENGAIEIALADLLASSWPRSAPLLEPAQAHFGWLGQEGTLGEHPAIAFLNARLRGMRFHEAVQLRTHPLHRAWNELTRPRLPRVLSQFLVKRGDVLDVIGTVRRHFPELEQSFDPERTTAWEDADGALIATVIRVAVVLYLMTALPRCDLSPPPEAASPVAQAADPSPAASFATVNGNAAMAEAWRDVFGEPHDSAVARESAPWFSGQFAAAVNGAPRNERDDDAGVAAALSLTRQVMAGTLDSATFDELIALQSVRLSWLRAARTQGGAEGCRTVLAGDLHLTDFTLSAPERAAEQRLAVRLLKAGKLVPPAARPARTSTVPRWLVADLESRSGLTPAQLAQAMGDTESVGRCDAVIALLEAMLAQPSKVPAELLRFN